MPSHMLNYPTTTTTTQPTPFRVMVWYGAASLWPPTTLKYAKHIIYVWSRSGRSMKRMGGPNHILQHVPSEKPRQNPTTQPTPFWSVHPYGHPPYIKHAKHLLYVWSRSGKSMKWMGGPNHILQHVPSEKPTENPTTVRTPSRVMVWYGVVALWLPAMVEGF